VRVFTDHTGSVNSVAFSPDGTRILTGSNDRTARLWETSSGQELLRLQGHTGWVNSVAFSPDGSYALIGDDRGWVMLWRIRSPDAGKLLGLFVAQYPVLAIHWREQNRVLLADTGGSRGRPSVYDITLEGIEKAE
jgi:WD40 repeat protein